MKNHFEEVNSLRPTHVYSLIFYIFSTLNFYSLTTMKKIGLIMASFGITTIILSLIDLFPALLMWIYNWGEITAWFIKIGFIIVGIVLFFMADQDVIDDQQPNIPS